MAGPAFLCLFPPITHFRIVFRRSPPVYPAIRMLFLSRPNVSRFESESILPAAAPSPESPAVWSERGLGALDGSRYQYRIVCGDQGSMVSCCISELCHSAPRPCKSAYSLRRMRIIHDAGWRRVKMVRLHSCFGGLRNRRCPRVLLIKLKHSSAISRLT